MSSLEKIKKQLDEIEVRLQKTRQLRKPIPPEKGIRVVRLGRRTHTYPDGSTFEEHGYEVKHDGKSVASGSVQPQPNHPTKGAHTCDIDYDGDLNDDVTDKYDKAVKAEHMKHYPNHVFV